ncbi:MAG: hypothetical protein D6696_18820 [Acidobacteria bacterium]|nr:MAG: hypothetical protein D6696_18820 [Acidobacteriota bacterium]
MTLIEDWFQATGGGGLVLPDGWFGRPHDNIHRLTFLAIRPLWLIMELDERLLLTVREPMAVRQRNGDLVISGFSSCVFDRKEYGGKRGFVKSYTDGELKFVAPPGA